MSKRHKNHETINQTFSTTEKVTTLEKGVDYQTVSTSTTTVKLLNTVLLLQQLQKKKRKKKKRKRIT